MKNKLFAKSFFISLLINVCLFLIIPYLTFFSKKIKYSDKTIYSLAVETKQITEKNHIIKSDKIINNDDDIKPKNNYENQILKTLNNIETKKTLISENNLPNINFNDLKISNFQINLLLLSGNFNFSNINISDNMELTNKIFNENELEIKPQIIYRVEPIYPYIAKELGIEGYIILQFIVNEIGLVENIKILESSPSDIFNDYTIKAVQQWKFTAGTINNKKVKTLCKIKINFKLNK